MDEYIEYLYLEYLRVFGGVKKDDPIEIAKEIFIEKLNEEQKEVFFKLLEMIRKRQFEEKKAILKYGFYNAKEIFKW